MGRKRKRSDRSSERLLRRIEKLEDKLRKRRKRSPTSSSRSSYSTRSGSLSPDPVRYNSNKKHDKYAENNANQPPIDIEPYDSSQSSPVRNDTLDSQAADTAPMTTNDIPVVASTSAASQPPLPTYATENLKNEKNEINHLNEEILTLLGDAPKEESPVGKDVHVDIATRLKDVLENGLKKDIKEKIIEEYPIPGNCQVFKAPVLNAEIKAAVSDLLQKKDSSLAARQGQIGVALAALTSAIDILVAEKSESSQTILKHISNASRLLCDSHYIDTRMRRNFLISTLNNKLKDTLKESKRDKYLFGEDLPEKLKATKAITKSSQELRSFKPKSVVTKTPAPSTSTNNLNWKHPQSNNQNAQRRPTATPHQRSAGQSTSRRGEPARRPTSSHANKSHAHYRQHKRS